MTSASEALAHSHPEEFALLLRDARAAEGLRPLGNGTAASDGAAPAEAAPPAEGD